MGRKKKIVTEEGGTPVEVDDDTADILDPVETDPVEVVVAPEKPTSARKVIWTATGELKGAFSEHGQHLADEEVMTVHADSLIRAGFAREASE